MKGMGWHGQSLRHRWAAMGHKMKRLPYQPKVDEYDYTPRTPMVTEAMQKKTWYMPFEYKLDDLPAKAYTNAEISKGKWERLAKTGNYMIYTLVDTGNTQTYLKGWHTVNNADVWALVPLAKKEPRTRQGVTFGGHKISKESRFKKYYREYLYSPITGEEYSASAGDYWNSPKEMVFKDSEGNNMELVGDSGLDRFGKATLKTIMRTVTVGDLIDRIGRKR